MMNRKVAITGLGLVSAVGHDVETACASFRCGLVRFSPASLRTVDPDTLDDVGVHGSPVLGVTDGFEGTGKYLRLINRTIDDLVRYAGLPLNDRQFWSSTQLILCLSYTRENEIFTPHLNCNILVENIIETKFRYLSLENCDVIQKGHASVIFGIDKALRLIKEGGIKRVIVLGVDSLVGKEEVLFYLQQNRIKTDENPEGFIPGEAGATFLLEECKEALARGAKIEGYIGATCAGVDDYERSVPERCQGSALARVVSEVIGDYDDVGSVYCDLNGEASRAKEWGSALIRIMSEHKTFDAQLALPAESFADCGAASGAVAVCAVIRSFARAYAVSKHALVWASSDSGEVGAVMLIKPDDEI